MIRAEIILHGARLGTLIIRNDGTGSEAVGHYDVTLAHDRRDAPPCQARVECYPRQERTALELVAEAIRALMNAHDLSQTRAGRRA